MTPLLLRLVFGLMYRIGFAPCCLHGLPEEARATYRRAYAN
jgi:hypothetical protein